jgi:hypothetical protein
LRGAVRDVDAAQLPSVGIEVDDGRSGDGLALQFEQKRTERRPLDAACQPRVISVCGEHAQGLHVRGSGSEAV